MHVRLMQRVDYFIGIPLCTLLKGVELLRKLLGFSRPPTPPKKILFIELSEMGSAFLAHSALTRAVRLVGRNNVYFLIFRRNRESVDLLGILPPAQVIIIEDSDLVRFSISSLAALLKIRSLSIDTVVDMELFSRATAIITYLSGAHNRIGFHNYTDEGLFRGGLLTHPVLLNNHQHIALNFLSLVRTAEDWSNDSRPLRKENMEQYLEPLPIISPNVETRDLIQNLLKEAYPSITKNHKLAIINPDPGLLPLRGWPIDRFREVAELLVEKDPTVLIVAIGLPQSRELCDRICSPSIRHAFINFCGKTRNLYDVITLLSMSSILVTNDSGPGHLASLSGVPAVVLFGPETPKRYGPLGKNITSLFAGLACSPCYTAANHRHSICTDNVCLKTISVDSVVQAAYDIMR